MRIGPLRRRRLNEALHELRRPAQQIALLIEARLGGDERAAACLESLAAGLALMDEAVNGSRATSRSCFVADELLADAAARWPGVALAGRIPATTIAGDRRALGRALDNLIANALTHGTAPVELSGALESDAVRIDIRDGGPGGGPVMSGRADPRHGHGLGIAAALAAEHGGSLTRPERGEAGTVASLRLPARSRDSG